MSKITFNDFYNTLEERKDIAELLVNAAALPEPVQQYLIAAAVNILNAAKWIQENPI